MALTVPAVFGPGWLFFRGALAALRTRTAHMDLPIALALGAGFVREGYSRRYLRIAGRWRDHVRYAILAEDWRAQRKRTR
jgi:cation transport ATPase